GSLPHPARTSNSAAAAATLHDFIARPLPRTLTPAVDFWPRREGALGMRHGGAGERRLHAWPRLDAIHPCVAARLARKGIRLERAHRPQPGEGLEVGDRKVAHQPLA